MRKYLALFCMFLLAACAGSSHAADGNWLATGGTKTHPDPLPSRSIVLLQPESGERLATTYFHDGHYDTGALRAINHLFRDRRANVIGKIDPELIDFLVDIRTRLGLPPNVTFEILSGYRTPASNAILGRHNSNVAIESLHMYGWAVDFRIPGVDGNAIAEIAKTMQRGGVAFYPKSNHVHVDLGNIRTWREK